MSAIALVPALALSLNRGAVRPLVLPAARPLPALSLALPEIPLSLPGGPPPELPTGRAVVELPGPLPASQPLSAAGQEAFGAAWSARFDGRKQPRPAEPAKEEVREEKKPAPSRRRVPAPRLIRREETFTLPERELEREIGVHA